jgi:phospholipid/cholesterol/gamma-HCH transport system permease protein
MTKQQPKTAHPAAFRMIQDTPRTVRMELAGDLTHLTLGPVWQRAGSALKSTRGDTLILDTRQVTHCNGAGVGFLAFLKTSAEKRGLKTEIPYLPDDLRQLLDRFTQTDHGQDIPKPRPLGTIRTAGKIAHDLAADAAGQVAFFAQVVLTSLWLLRHPRRFRTGDFLKTLELAGFQALGIVSLLGLLFGLIMAFSSAMPLRQFGVEIYVADLVAYALVRVLGPFITAIIVTGRTGSAYAAEIGTMKINDEISALKVMNLDPVSFLAIPRILATILVMPVLTLFASLFGMIGSALVITSMGYTLTTYLSHVQSTLTPTDVVVGLVKALIFGGLIGQIGCLRGLQTKTGAGSVGISTTRAVVSAIVLLVLTEGLFSVLINFLEI